MLARALNGECKDASENVVSLAREELDITNEEQIEKTFKDFQPTTVINCAAYTDVDKAEKEPFQARAVNADGVRNLAKACNRINARLITVSTDYVFDGRKGKPYLTTDEPNPLGEYGKSKLGGERAALSECANSVVARIGWVFGEGGSNFLSVMPQLLEDGKTIKAITDKYGAPTFAVDVSNVLRRLAKGNERGIFHITNGGDGASFYDFAMRICEYGGYSKDLVVPTKSVELKRAAARPIDSRLESNCARLGESWQFRDWGDALQEFLIDRKKGR